MKTCKSCGMQVYGGYTACPLCDLPLPGGAPERKLYPAYEHPPLPKKDRQSGFVALTIFVLALCISLNIATYWAAPVVWSLIVAAPLLYAWLLIRNTILSKQSGGARALLHLIGMTAMFLVFDITSGFLGWSVNFLIPFIMLVTTIVLTVAMSRSDLKWEKHFGYTITLICMGFIPILLFAFGIATVLWTSLMCASYSLLTILWLYFGKTTLFRAELAWRFYV
ncbi:DUF6320 domain-containing protein [Christensenellaceae bacterium OttesenSCG-928-K19]|nr:DUF6320 domain-containing protein [Christensenellaceae bacterium OttesenSCG-928-K19]